MKKRKLLLASAMTIMLSTSLIACTAPANDKPGETDVVKVTSVTLNKETLSLEEGKTETLLATVIPANATDKALTWASSDSKVASVDANGKVTALKAGSATITATLTSNKDIKAACVVTVTAASKEILATAISFEKEAYEMPIGQIQKLRVTYTPSDTTQKQLSWETSDASIVSVDAEGKLTAVSAGKATITATLVANSAIKATCKITVLTAEQESEITSLSAPQFLSEYEARTAVLDDVETITQKGASAANSTYYKNENGTRDTYKVGSVNPFKFEVSGSIITKDLETKEIAHPHTVTKFEEYVGDDFVELSEDEVKDIVEINVEKGEYQFKEAANGKHLKMTVSADEKEYKKVASTCSPIEFEFEVFDGYNVYSIEELSVMHNANNSWDAVKEELGIKDLSVKGVALHANLELTNEDLPANYKYSEEEIENYLATAGTDFAGWISLYNGDNPGEENDFNEETGKAALIDSVKDQIALYEIHTDANTDFTFEGNYFTLDASKVKQVYSFDEAIEKGALNDESKFHQGSHTELFGFNVNIPGGHNAHNGGKVTFNNATIKANGARSSDIKYMGGMMAYKIGDVEAHMTNINTSNTFITYITQEFSDNGYELTKLYIDRSKCFDSYNSLLYIHGTKNNFITNSYMTGAGGAIFLLDDKNADQKDHDEHGHPEVDAANSFFENWVTGQEPWFSVHKASSLVQNNLVGVGTLGYLGQNAQSFEDGMSIVKLADEKAFVNMIAILICGANPLGNTKTEGLPLEGHLNIVNDGVDTGSLDMANLYNPSLPFAQLDNLLYSNAQQDIAGIMFGTSAGGHSALLNPNGSNALFMTGQEMPPVAPYVIDDYSKMISEQLPTAAQVDQGYGTKLLYNMAHGNYTYSYLKPDSGLNYLGLLLGNTPVKAN